MAKDYYQILGLNRDASPNDIRKAYRSLALKYHPDKNQGNKEAESKFKEISTAYSCLSDPEKRSNYDMFPEGKGDMPNRSSGFEDIFDHFGDIFGAGFGFENRRAKRVVKGEPISLKLSLSLEEVLTGIDQEISFVRKINCVPCDGNGYSKRSDIARCPNCKGSGSLISQFGPMSVRTPCPSCAGLGSVIKNPCSSCSGSGDVDEKKKVAVKIPSGIEKGNSLRLEAIGNYRKGDDIPGDVIVEIDVEESSKFARKGPHIYSQQSISIPIAILGGEISVELIDGITLLKIPEGTQSHTYMSISERGLPIDIGDSERGHHYVKIVVDIPKTLSEKDRLLVESLSL